MQGELDNPFAKARESYTQIEQLSENLAIAAHNHPEVPYEHGHTPEIDVAPETTQMTESEANADIALYTALISRQLDQTNNFFFMDFEREVRDFIMEEDYAHPERMMGVQEKVQDSYSSLLEDVHHLDYALYRNNASHKMIDSENPVKLEPVNSKLFSRFD